MSLREIKLMSDFYLTTDIEKYRDTLESICKESSNYLVEAEGRLALSAFADVYEIIPDLPKNFPVKCFAFIYKDEAVGYTWIVEDTERELFFILGYNRLNMRFHWLCIKSCIKSSKLVVSLSKKAIRYMNQMA